MISVEELIYASEFSQTITVTRTTTTVSNYRQVTSSTTLTVPGIITAASERDLQMVPAADSQTGAINVFTKDALYLTQTSGTTKYISDIISFEGKTYKVSAILPDMQYGFCKSVCTLMERT